MRYRGFSRCIPRAGPKTVGAGPRGLDFQFNAYAIIVVSHDPAKRRRNLCKHGIDLPGCMAAFDAPMLTAEDTREAYGEQRFVSVGIAHGRVVVLVWTERDDGPRLISCREAEPHERKTYFEAFPLH